MGVKFVKRGITSRPHTLKTGTDFPLGRNLRVCDNAVVPFNVTKGLWRGYFAKRLEWRDIFIQNEEKEKTLISLCIITMKYRYLLRALREK
jgi:hypothetical protein